MTNTETTRSGREVEITTTIVLTDTTSIVRNRREYDGEHSGTNYWLVADPTQCRPSNKAQFASAMVGE
jgi:hypothetical protein